MVGWCGSGVKVDRWTCTDCPLPAPLSRGPCVCRGYIGPKGNSLESCQTLTQADPHRGSTLGRDRKIRAVNQDMKKAWMQETGFLCAKCVRGAEGPSQTQVWAWLFWIEFTCGGLVPGGKSILVTVPIFSRNLEKEQRHNLPRALYILNTNQKHTLKNVKSKKKKKPPNISK